MEWKKCEPFGDWTAETDYGFPLNIYELSGEYTLRIPWGISDTGDTQAFKSNDLEELFKLSKKYNRPSVNEAALRLKYNTKRKLSIPSKPDDKHLPAKPRRGKKKFKGQNITHYLDGTPIP